MELTFPLEVFGEKEYLHFSPQFYRYYLKSHRTICFDIYIYIALPTDFRFD